MSEIDQAAEVARMYMTLSVSCLVLAVVMLLAVGLANWRR